MKNSIIPPKLKIGGYTYKVVLKERFAPAMRSNTGLCQNDLSTITISAYFEEAKIDKTKIIQTLLHEILHAIDSIYCGNIFSEDDIVTLEHAWFAVLADNNLYISYKNKLPDNIRILGHTYNIYYNQEFEFHNNSAYTIVQPNEKNILCGKGADIEHTKTHILISISQIFEDSSIIVEDFPYIQFCQGLYQVLYDNKLDRLIRRYCK